MRNKGSSVREASSRTMTSVSAAVLGLATVSRGLMTRDREEVGGEPRGRVNIVRNQAEVILSVVEGTRKGTSSCETRNDVRIEGE